MDTVFFDVRRAFWNGLLLAALLALPVHAGAANEEEPGDGSKLSVEELSALSLEDLMGVEITSVSKRAQKLSETPAAVYVLTNEEIRRSGVQTIPDALRLVPGLHVAQINANQWAVTARGYNNQFANKLLVMIDGRSVYTPLFSGTYWDVQDVMLEDVDRIEVIRGPGGTIWGANAVNGVINIISKSSRDTQGLLVTSSAGLHERYGGAGRWGGTGGDTFHYRGYVKGFDNRDHDSPLDGVSGAGDEWHQVRGGLRMDWDVTEADLLTLQGDYYRGKSGETPLIPGPAGAQDVAGGNFIARWTRTISETSDLSTQLYYDRTERESSTTYEEDRDTVDLGIQHRFEPFARNELIWGGGYRYTNRWMDPPVYMIVDSKKEKNDLYSAFIQDEINVIDGLLRLTLGSKFEHNDYTGFEYQPSARVLLTPHEKHTAWAAFSRAVRTPSSVEMHLTTPIPPLGLLVPNDDLDSESVLAFEAGYRAEPLERVSFDIAAYYNEYRDLVTVDMIGPGLATTGNGMDAKGYGVELVANWLATDYLRLTAVYTYMKVKGDLEGASMAHVTTPLRGSVPEHQFQIRSRLDLPWNFEFDSQLFWVDDVDEQFYFDGNMGTMKSVGDYVRLDLRLGWRSPWGLEFSLVGQNLTKANHFEFGNQYFDMATPVPRTFYGMVTFNY